MKRLLTILLLVAAAGCSRPKEIPDKDLEMIFRDIFLTNAYTNSHTIQTDSLDIYEPIFSRYGYKPRDLQYTLAHYSRRKSSRLSDVLEAAIARLNKEYEGYERQVAVLDTIQHIARERFREVSYTDTLLRVSSLRDTARLRIRIPAREGTYKINYSYLVDTTDKNPSVRTTQIVTDSAGRQLANRTNWMQRGNRTAYEVEFEAPPHSAHLEVVFGGYTKSSTVPHMRIDTFSVVYYLPVKVALDSLNRSLLDYKLIVDGKEYTRGFAPDSVALRTDPPRLAAPRDTLP